MSPHAGDGHESAAAEAADEDDEQEADSHAAADTSIRQQEHVGFPDLAEQLLVEVSSETRSMGMRQPSLHAERVFDGSSPLAQQQAPLAVSDCT